MKSNNSLSVKKDKVPDPRKPSEIVVKTNLENSFDTRWAEVKIEGKNISSRSNHASVIHEKILYIHGGFDADKGMLSDFHCMNISEAVEEYTWVKLNNQCNGQLIKLKSHSAVVHKDTIYLFGGEITPINSSNLIFAYHIPTKKWEKISPNIDLPKVDSHSAVVLGDKMVVYGGYVPEKATYMTNMYAFDFEKKGWELYYQGGKGPEPEGRSDFDMLVHQGSIWLFGGSNGKMTLNDFWTYNQGKWQKIEFADGPEVRI